MKLALRCNEAAAALGLSERTFQNHVAAGLIPPPRRIGRIPLWSVSELEAWFLDLAPEGAHTEGAADDGGGDSPNLVEQLDQWRKSDSRRG